MKIAKYLVILSGLIGLFALTRPLVIGQLTGGLIRVELSSLEGFTIELSEEAIAQLERQGIEEDAQALWQDTIRRQSGYAQVDQAEAVLMTLAMVPSCLLLFGVIGLKRFGRGLGLACFMLGGAQILVWFALRQMVKIAEQQPIYETIDTTNVVSCLLISGCLAVAGGLAATIKPEPQKSTET